MGPIVSLEQVSFRYRPTQPLLENISLQIEENSVTCIFGDGGTGKSALLKVMAGLLEPQSGEVRVFDGRWMKDSPFRSKVGMTFQRGGLFDSMTCVENLSFVLRELLKLAPTVATDRAVHAMAEVGLEGCEQYPTHALSGGMQKRLGLARALCIEPQLLLCDDPLAGLDPATASDIWTLILSLQKAHQMSLVVATADISVIKNTVDTFVYLDLQTSPVIWRREERFKIPPSAEIFFESGEYDRA